MCAVFTFGVVVEDTVVSAGVGVRVPERGSTAAERRGFQFVLRQSLLHLSSQGVNEPAELQSVNISSTILIKNFYLFRFCLIIHNGRHYTYLSVIFMNYLVATLCFSFLLLCSSTALSSSSSLSRSSISSSLSSSCCRASPSCRALSNFLSSSRRICSFSSFILHWAMTHLKGSWTTPSICIIMPVS